MTEAPTPRLVDHLRVTWLLVLSILGVVPILLWVAFSWILKPLVKGRYTRRLAHDAGGLAEPPAIDPETWRGRTLFVVAGEASGDKLAARVVGALKRSCPGLRVRGYAGPLTEAAGAELDRNLVDHAVMGVTAVIASLGFWWQVCAETLARLREDPPDVFLTVDFPGLNVRLARWARKRGIHTVHLVAPAVWAYAPWRVFRWRRAVDHMVATFPFEASLFEGSGIHSTYVGHPLFEEPLDPARTPATWPGEGPCTVELLPGSRRQEIGLHTSVMLDAATRIERRLPEARFVVRLPGERQEAVFREARALLPVGAGPTRLEVTTGHTSEGSGDPEAPLLGAIACSGTVTAELGAACVPMAIVYRLGPVMRFLAWIGLTAPFMGLANLIAGRLVVPERRQVSAEGRAVSEDLLATVGTREAWTRTRADLDLLVRQRLAAANVADRAARAVLQDAEPRSR